MKILGGDARTHRYRPACPVAIKNSQQPFLSGAGGSPINTDIPPHRAMHAKRALTLLEGVLVSIFSWVAIRTDMLKSATCLPPLLCSHLCAVKLELLESEKSTPPPTPPHTQTFLLLLLLLLLIFSLCSLLFQLRERMTRGSKTPTTTPPSLQSITQRLVSPPQGNMWGCDRRVEGSHHLLLHCSKCCLSLLSWLTPFTRSPPLACSHLNSLNKTFLSKGSSSVSKLDTYCIYKQ